MSIADSVRKVQRLRGEIETLVESAMEPESTWYFFTPGQVERMMLAVERCNRHAQEASGAQARAMMVSSCVLFVEATWEVHRILDAAYIPILLGKEGPNDPRQA